jgi:hypothetical protein
MPQDAPESPETGWRKFLTLPWILLVATLTAITSWIATFVLTDVEQRSAERNPVRVTLEMNPAKVGGFSDEPQSVLLPGTREINEGPGEGCTGFHEWGHGRGGIDARATRLQVTVQGQASGQTLISKMRVIVTKRSTPLKGVTAACPSAGDANLRFLTIDLDQDNPQVEYKGKKPFGFTVEDGEVETLLVTARAEKAYYSWYLELDVVSGPNRHIIKIDNNGKAFETTADDPRQQWSWNYKDTWFRPNGEEKKVGTQSAPEGPDS